MSYQKGFTYPFKGKNGDAKGLPLADCSNEDLQFYLKSANPDDPQYGEKNKKMIAECQRIIQARRSGSNASVSNVVSSPVEAGKTPNPTATEILAVCKRSEAAIIEMKGILERALGNTRIENEPPPSAKALFSRQTEEEPF